MNTLHPDPASLLRHTELLMFSYQRVTGKPWPLFDPLQSNPESLVYDAPYALVSHNTDSDPVFNYANRTAQTLFEMSWSQFIVTPSRLSAELVKQEERIHLLEHVSQHGYVDNYKGVRVASSGRRFMIENVTVWNVYDVNNDYRGQAAVFDHWYDL